MVGVPALVRRWLSGPSSRIGWPAEYLRRSMLISGWPKMKPKISAVKNAPPARNVM